LVGTDNLHEQTVLDVERGPMGMAFHPADPTRLYVANHDHGSVSVIDLAARAVLHDRAFATAPGPETLVLV
jgi:DNA-binding beta-propeller fold protein YncE